MKRIVNAVCVLLAGLLLFAGCMRSQAGSAAPYRQISPEKAYAMLQKDKLIDFVFIGTEKEWRAEHITGSAWLPYEQIRVVCQDGYANHGVTILLYSLTAGQSELAAREFLNQGFKNVYDMGALADWPYDTVCGEDPTQAQADASSGME